MKHFSMKRNIFSKCLYGMMALGLLASCSNEPLLEDTNDKVLENETTTYIRISLMGEGIGSRASADEPGYLDGEKGESAVGIVKLAFFDSDRNLVKMQSIDMSELTPSDGTGNTVDKFYTVVTPINLPENANHPAWVVAYVNPTSAQSDLEFNKLEHLMTRIRTREQVSPTDGLRTMNNSVYYDATTTTGQPVLRYATPVNFKEQFHHTEADAKAADAKAIEITVERVEAKVTVTQPDDNNISSVSADEGEYSLQFVQQGWYVNATETRTFLIKNYRNDGNNYTSNTSSPTDNNGIMTSFYSLAELEEALGTNFNSKDNLRSFWAIDPTYFTDDNADLYPSVSYEVKYLNNQETIINSDGKTFPLLYQSFNDVMRNYGKDTRYVKYKTTSGNTTKSHEYVLENTMSLNTLKSGDAMASMTSVELLGYYIVKDKAGNTVFDGSVPAGENEDKAFYIRHEGTKVDPKYRFMLGKKEAIDYFLEHAGNMLLVKERAQEEETGNYVENGNYVTLTSHYLSENTPKEGDYGISYDDFDLVYPKGSSLSEQWRTLTIKKGADGKYNQNIFIYDATMNNGAGGYKNITDSDIEALNTRFFNTFGEIERFQEGKAHFTVPLKHIWYPDVATSNSNAFDVTNVNLGWYGVVRNHVYDLKINKISGLGSGIGDPEQPIVPPTDNQQYYISTKLNILKWRQVSQNVDL